MKCESIDTIFYWCHSYHSFVERAYLSEKGDWLSDACFSSSTVFSSFPIIFTPPSTSLPHLNASNLSTKLPVKLSTSASTPPPFKSPSLAFLINLLPYVAALTLCTPSMVLCTNLNFLHGFSSTRPCACLTHLANPLTNPGSTVRIDLSLALIRNQCSRCHMSHRSLNQPFWCATAR
ncbi:hypothetical protein HBI81_142040 [Parastagonospora nodorum]|nr:hypothetical protein HBI10_175620 [Parastagonospora nodorum]KAH4292395.1 hypothetical protein HBI01_179940 [Parastagonospora nodorum]KAH4479746.1 hypothetical protein HBH88_183980 [Parastagonospora nodorum]KAH4581311.1 hypothetical protein HBH83_169930 [Parastagonospora nodorum]KAH4656791.1 hypothetical protein HBH80_156430 [Parastagonospora nodorum]